MTGGTLDLGGGLHPFDDGTKLRNGVTVLVDRGGTLDGSGLISLGQGSSLVQGGGATITGQHDIAGSGSYTWGSGTISGQLTVEPGVTTHISDLAADSSHTRSFTTVGSKAASLLVGGGATQNSATPVTMGAATEITNGHGSTWTITKGGFSGGVCCAFPALVINLGTFAVNPGAGKSGTFSFLSFRNRGSLRVLTGTAAFSGVDPVQFDGSTSVKGTLSTSGSYDVEGGTLSGPGKVSGNLIDNGGSVSPGTLIGTLHITGNFTQGSGGTLVADLKNAANDLLVVGGTAQLNGTLKLKLDQSGSLSRTARTLVQAGSVTGPSATTGLNTLGGKWAIHTTSTLVRLVPV